MKSCSTCYYYFSSPKQGVPDICLVDDYIITDPMFANKCEHYKEKEELVENNKSKENKMNTKKQTKAEVKKRLEQLIDKTTETGKIDEKGIKEIRDSLGELKNELTKGLNTFNKIMIYFAKKGYEAVIEEKKNSKIKGKMGIGVLIGLALFFSSLVIIGIGGWSWLPLSLILIAISIPKIIIPSIYMGVRKEILEGTKSFEELVSDYYLLRMV